MNFAIIVAAGFGTRMNSDLNKVFLRIGDKTVIEHTIEKFQNCKEINEIIVVSQKNEMEKIERIKKENNFSKIKNIVEGGIERQDSVFNGFSAIKNAKENDIVVIHNGSNPLVAEKEVVLCINESKKNNAAVCAFALKDTIKKSQNGFVSSTIDRKNVYQMQTPQCIKYGILKKALENAKRKKLKVTDDIALIEAIGEKAKIVECSYINFKITTQEDLKMAEAILMKRNDTAHNFRVGFGQDSHAFSKDRKKKLVLGGFAIDEAGMDADSDGDVILHALFNAIASAIGERGLGFYADSMFKKGITDSKEYLKLILDKMEKSGFDLNNVSISIEAGKPKLEEHTNNIKKSLSKIISLETCKIGITYTSGDVLTSFGKGEGMQCFCFIGLSKGID